MPIYEYRCEDCEKLFETFVQIANGESTNCPECRSSRVARLYSSFAVSGAAHDRAEAGGSNDGSGCGCGNCTCH